MPAVDAAPRNADDAASAGRQSLVLTSGPPVILLKAREHAARCFAPGDFAARAARAHRRPLSISRRRATAARRVSPARITPAADAYLRRGRAQKTRPKLGHERGRRWRELGPRLADNSRLGFLRAPRQHLRRWSFLSAGDFTIITALGFSLVSDDRKIRFCCNIIYRRHFIFIFIFGRRQLFIAHADSRRASFFESAPARLPLFEEKCRGSLRTSAYTLVESPTDAIYLIMAAIGWMFMSVILRAAITTPLATAARCALIIIRRPAPQIICAMREGCRLRCVDVLEPLR